MKTIKHKISGLVYGKDGVTKSEARQTYISGFKEGIQQHKSFWKNKKVKFI